MKRIRSLDKPTAGLLDYLNISGDNPSWEEFRSHRNGDAYKELVDTLLDIQHGLCGYCEINITDVNRQIEHVVPQSDSVDGKMRALDHSNMIISCKGGAQNSTDSDQWSKPKHNLSCGQAKGNRTDKDFIDPRALPALPSLMQVKTNGHITSNEKGCADAGIDTCKVDKTIEILGLNSKRLQLKREKRLRALDENWEPHFEDHQAITFAARAELLPDGENKLRNFFTTSRSFFFPFGEEILEKDPQRWI